MAPAPTPTPPDRADDKDAPAEDPRRSDPFPKEQAVEVLKRLPSYARLAYGLSLEPDLPRARRIALLGALAYLVSPLDAIPGLIPVVGQIDDVLVVLLGLRFALGGLTSEQRRRHLDAAGLTDTDMATDLDAIAALGAWLLRAGGRAGIRVSAVALDVGGHWGARVARRGGVVATRAGEAGSRRVRGITTSAASRVPRPALRRGRERPPA